MSESKDLEFDRAMHTVGFEAVYAKGKIFNLSHYDGEYCVRLIDCFTNTTTEVFFDSAEAARDELKKLSSVNPNRDYDADFDSFMAAVADSKQPHDSMGAPFEPIAAEPQVESKIVNDIAIELLNNMVVLSRMQAGLPAFAIDPSDWPNVKQAIDDMLESAKP